MLDFIPLQYYTTIYYYLLLIIVLITFFRSNNTAINSSRNLGTIKSLSGFLLVIVLFYMGLRPVNYRFGDMVVYNHSFEMYQQGMSFIGANDIVFDFFMYNCAQIMTASTFFLMCALLYVLPLWAACRKWFKDYHYYAFLALVASFSFWAFGTNGIRNGIATSVFLYALSRDKIVFKILFVLIAIGFHKSLVIPTAALILTYFYADPKKYFYGWLACIPLSLIAGGFWEGLFAGLMADDRVSYLTGTNEQGAFSSTGFRWDFLLYSASAVYAAYFFIFKKKFINPTYNRLVCIYLAANGFWILVIRANFSNRFAYLSWFMMGIIIVYPFLTKIQIKNQHKVLATVLVAYFAFTYLMNVILYN
ncbi:EpsG family protein [Flavobacterium flavipallidum]|uniref:EpsG family protein n=1 Tax=Flavobacterium flavipallidum TaxID=3139140 RepID=A0ABU9HJN8_9FLAO